MKLIDKWGQNVFLLNIIYIYNLNSLHKDKRIILWHFSKNRRYKYVFFTKMNYKDQNKYFHESRYMRITIMIFWLALTGYPLTLTCIGHTFLSWQRVFSVRSDIFCDQVDSRGLDSSRAGHWSPCRQWTPWIHWWKQLEDGIYFPLLRSKRG